MVTVGNIDVGMQHKGIRAIGGNSGCRSLELFTTRSLRSDQSWALDVVPIQVWQNCGKTSIRQKCIHQTNPVGNRRKTQWTYLCDTSIPEGRWRQGNFWQEHTMQAGAQDGILVLDWEFRSWLKLEIITVRQRVQATMWHFLRLMIYILQDMKTEILECAWNIQQARLQRRT